ncbi:MAG: RNA-binding S4 domain-containing protein [Clostridiaceae bacterium]
MIKLNTQAIFLLAIHLKRENMRLDKFLKVSRLIKRRTVAKDACDSGRVTINGKVSKAGTVITEGDIIEIVYASRKVRAKVLDIREVVRKDDAAAMYEILEGAEIE